MNCENQKLINEFRSNVLSSSKKDEIESYSNLKVIGYDFNQGVDFNQLIKTFKTTGFQATNLGFAIDLINEMIKSRDDAFQDDHLETDPFIRRKNGCTIFFGFTSNMVSSGIREIIKFLVQHKMIDCIVTTAGGIEEDIIKCLAPTFVGDFDLKGSELRSKAINRIGNLLIPNENYCKFEDWIIPILDEMIQEQKENNLIWSPSKMITKLGQKINNKDSICYWAAINKIPIFCPAIIDGSIGDMIYSHSFKNPGLIIDVVQDIRRINSMSMKAQKSGILVVGGGVVKHHVCNANLMRNGADYSVYINTSNEFDGSDSGAKPDEAVSWGKIRSTAKPVKINADASIVFPLIVAQTFAKHVFVKN